MSTNCFRSWETLTARPLLGLHPWTPLGTSPGLLPQMKIPVAATIWAGSCFLGVLWLPQFKILATLLTYIVKIGVMCSGSPASCLRETQTAASCCVECRL